MTNLIDRFVIDFFMDYPVGFDIDIKVFDKPLNVYAYVPDFNLIIENEDDDRPMISIFDLNELRRLGYKYTSIANCMFKKD